MNGAHRRCILLAIALVLSSSIPAYAAGTVNLSWTDCPQTIVSSLEVVESHAVLLRVWVAGETATHTGFRLRLRGVPLSGTLADAWRFDADGCQPIDRFTVQTYPQFSKCPVFGGSTSTEQKYYVVPAGQNYAEFGVDVGYSEPRTSQSSANFLANFHFIHAMSTFGQGSGGECGGQEEPICFVLEEAVYRDTEGVEHAWSFGSSVVIAAGPGELQPCDPVPAQASSWGLLKRQYRH
jgi:hypothetical protein